MKNKKIALRAKELLEDMKAVDVVILDVQDISSITDYFVIASGTSARHVDALGEEVKFKLKKEGIQASHTDGLGSGSWILLDYFSVMVHVFHHETRQFYNLEGLWEEASHVS